MSSINSLLGNKDDFFKYFGLIIFACFIIYLICKTISFNYRFMEGLVEGRKTEVADILKSGGDGGRVGVDHERITERLEDNRNLLKKMLQLPQDTGKLREQLEDFNDNVKLEELRLLNEASSKEVGQKRIIQIGKELKAYKRIKGAIMGTELDKKSGWL